MPDRYIESHIARIPLFAGLPPEHLALLTSAFEVRRYEAGEIIFAQGAPTQGFLLLVSGLALLTQRQPDGSERRITVVHPNQYLGQEALFRDGTETMTLQVLESATVLLLTRARLLSLASSYPDFGARFGIAPSVATVAASATGGQAPRFKGQRPNEEALIVTHRHWWAFARLLILPILLAMVLGGLGLLAQVEVITLALCGLSVIAPGLLAVYFYLEWRNDLIIVTDQRVVHIARTILTFKENISEVPIHSVHEVNVEIGMGDILANLLGYGHIELKTSGQAGNLMLDHIPNPRQFQKVILEDRDRYHQREAERNRQAMRAEVERWIKGGTVDTPPTPQATPSGRRQIEAGSALLPTRIKLENGDILLRKHPIVWVRHTFLPIVVCAGALILGVGLSFTALGGMGLLLGGFLFLVAAIWLYWSDWDWRNDYYLISSNSIVLVHRRPLWLENKNDQILLSQVDNVVAETNGLFPQLFQYGNVRISLVGADKHKMFESVPDPSGVQAEISRRRALLKQRQAEEAAKQQQRLVGEYLTLYDQMRNPDRAPNTVHNTPPPPQGTTPPAGRSSAPQPPVAPPLRDGSRPPSVPQLRPHMSPGKPYTPPPQTGNRPPRFPQVSPKGEDER